MRGPSNGDRWSEATFATKQTSSAYSRRGGRGPSCTSRPMPMSGNPFSIRPNTTTTMSAEPPVCFAPARHTDATTSCFPVGARQGACLLGWTPKFPELDAQITHAWTWLRDKMPDIEAIGLVPESPKPGGDGEGLRGCRPGRCSRQAAVVLQNGIEQHLRAGRALLEGGRFRLVVADALRGRARRSSWSARRARCRRRRGRRRRRCRASRTRPSPRPAARTRSAPARSARPATSRSASPHKSASADRGSPAASRASAPPCCRAPLRRDGADRR